MSWQNEPAPSRAVSISNLFIFIEFYAEYSEIVDPDAHVAPLVGLVAVEGADALLRSVIGDAYFLYRCQADALALPAAFFLGAAVRPGGEEAVFAEFFLRRCAAVLRFEGEHKA